MQIMKQVLSALAHLHAHKIIHRDIKADNVVLVKPTGIDVKLIDFGVSKDLSQSPSCTFVGTRDYIAPEITLVATGNADSYGPSCDLWSCGILMFFLATRTFPFKDDAPMHLQKPLETSSLYFSPAGRHLLSRFLTKDPAQRITAEEALLHPFFNPDVAFVQPEIPSLGNAAPPNPIQYTAVYDYPPHPEEPFRLVFTVGDTITLIEKREQGWLFGSCGERKGLFPEGYVKELSQTPSSSSINSSSPAAPEASSGCLLS